MSKLSLISKDNLQRFKTNLENTYGTANNPAKLDADGHLTESQLPNSVHDVIECATTSAFPQTGVASKLYLDLSQNILYRWDSAGEKYVSTSTPDAVKYTAQNLTDSQKEQARQNIGAASSSAIPNGAVLYTQQTLTGEEKTQARTNIGAASSSDVSGLSETVSTLNDNFNNFGNFVREITEDEGGINVRYDNNHTDTISTGLDFDGAVVDENNYLYLKKGDTVLSNDVFTPVLLPSGGGGGGSASTIALTGVVRPTTIRNGEQAIFSFVATSSDATDISVAWYVNNKEAANQTGESGTTFTFNAQARLNGSARNTVEARITSVGGASLTRKWTVECVAFSLAWGSSIDAIMLNNSNTNVYVPIEVSAEANSTNIVSVAVTSGSGTHTETRTVTGSLTLTVLLDKTYFTSGINYISASMVSADNPEDTANDISYTLIWGTGVSSPIVAFAKPTISCNQFDLVDINYFVFDPNNEVASATIQIDQENPVSITANRTLRTYQFSPLVSKTYNVALTCESSVANMQIIAAQVDYNINYYTDDSLVYVLDPIGHSNTDVDRDSFADLTLSTNFDWENGGFRTDRNGAPAFVVKKGNTALLPRCLFQDEDSNGKTIDISFAVRNSDQYDAVAMQELNDGSTRGIILKANNGELRLNNAAGQEFRYCEESRVDLSVLVEKATAQRVATVWLDGIPANVNKYASSGILVQDENALLIGSEHCDVWVYGIRVYNAQLTTQQMIQNYVSCGNTTQEKVRRYSTNTIVDSSDRISVEALHLAAPTLTIVQIFAPRMTTSKEDPVPADITIQDGSTILELSAASGPETEDGTVFKVQGTSSAAYGRSSYNLDIDFKGTGKKYKISESSIPVNYLNIKVNVASSENANNVNAVDWYNTYQPYVTPSRATAGVRDVIEGKPCAVFFTNTNNVPVWFSSLLVEPNETVLYAMGDICNSKKNKAVFGQDGSGEHPTKACIEVSGNDTEPERFRSTAATFNPNADDGKGRWETEEWDAGQGEYKKVKHFEWRMNPSNANLSEVVTSWDNAVAWVVSTIGNPTKFKNEVHQYFAIDSLLYHFLMLEFFEAYDNVSKNTFYSYDWDETEERYLWNVKAAYDMDTILAADNDGKPFGDYGIDYGDTVDGTPSGRQYFNAVTNTIYKNIQAAYYNELSRMYISLRSQGAWDSNAILEKWDTYQSKRPHAAMIIDAYNKYIKPYKTIISADAQYDDSYLPRLQGSKTYWRKQFLTYQTSYMDGKYGYYNTTNATTFRTNGAEGTKTFSVKAYAKTYMTFIKDSTRVASQKVQAGEVTVFNNVSVGNNTTLYVTPDKLIQYIRPLNETQNSTFAAPGASKLMEVNLGGESVNNDWPSGTGLNIPSVLLQSLSIRNMPNFSDSLDVSANVELKTIDTRNTQTGYVTLPSFAPLESVQLNACTGIYAHNLNKVNTFTMEGGQNLVSVQIENCNATVSNAIATYLVQTVNASNQATKRIRAIGINWSFDNLDALSKIASTWKGYNALGQEQNAPVVTGIISVTTMSKKKLEAINNVWGSGSVDDHLDEINRVWSYGNLSIHYQSLVPYYAVNFFNMDGTRIKDKQNNDYIQYIDLNGEAYDPILAGEINTPVYIDPVGQYRYTFTGWNGLTGAVDSDKNVTAEYSSEIITYTVRWYDKVGGSLYDIKNNIEYGAEAVYDESGTIGFPTLADEESAGYYKVFKGWDKSTGFVTSDLDVYAVWDRAQLPPVNTKLNQMSIAEIYAVARQNKASTYFSEEDEVDIPLGKDFTFTNVSSSVLLQNRYFDGTSIVRRNDIKLFDENADTFTLAVSYEFNNNQRDATLISCYDQNGAEGFKVYYSNPGSASPSQNECIKIQWGNRDEIISYGRNKGILVIKHRKGSKNLIVSSDNGGRYIVIFNGYNSDDTAQGTWQTERYAGYNPTILYSEVPRLQNTISDAVLSFGGIAVGTSGFDEAAKGWIHWCKIWHDDLGEKIIKELVCWPHESIKMQYRGAGLYTKTDGTGTKDSASFISKSALSQYYEMYQASENESTTEGGWTNSKLRSFLNSRFYNALPYEWQFVIQEVYIRTKGGSDNYNVLVTTSDKIFAPSYADLGPTTDSLMINEGYQIPWITTNRDRVKFMGVQIPETGKMIIGVDDPTLLEGTTVNEFDVWGKTNAGSDTPSRYYVYISAETARTHDFVGGRNVSDTTNNIVATGAQGGVWVRSASYWIRTNSSTQSSNSFHYVIGPEGNFATTSISSDGYQERGIVVMFAI